MLQVPLFLAACVYVHGEVFHGRMVRREIASDKMMRPLADINDLENYGDDTFPTKDLGRSFTDDVYDTESPASVPTPFRRTSSVRSDRIEDRAFGKSRNRTELGNSNGEGYEQNLSGFQSFGIENVSNASPGLPPTASAQLDDFDILPGMENVSNSSVELTPAIGAQPDEFGRLPGTVNVSNSSAEETPTTNVRQDDFDRLSRSLMLLANPYGDDIFYARHGFKADVQSRTKGTRSPAVGRGLMITRVGLLILFVCILGRRVEREPSPGAPSLGVLRLDYSYTPIPGDIDHPGSFDYDVYYKMAKGLTFEMCQSGQMTDEVHAEFIKVIVHLREMGVSVITGDCGFMMWFQELARKLTHLPVLMSSLASLPAITCAYGPDEQIAIFTANSTSLESMRDLIREECGVDSHDIRYVIIGCEDVDGFEAVALGEAVDVERVAPGIVRKAQEVVFRHPEVRAILMECTQLGVFSDAVRLETGLPVYDAITSSDFFVRSRMLNPQFGSADWDEALAGKDSMFSFVHELGVVGASVIKPIIDASMAGKHILQSQIHAISKFIRARKVGLKIGIVCLDYDHHRSLGEVGHPGSFPYEIHYEKITGLTSEMSKSGIMPSEIELELGAKIRKLEDTGVSLIIGDCGFMVQYQSHARLATQLPVVMSSLATLPTIACAYNRDEQIAILTENGSALKSMRNPINEELGLDLDEARYVIIDCEDVPGTGRDVLGTKLVDLPTCTPYIVDKTQEVLATHPQVRAILVECVRFTGCSDALRSATRLPVFDLMTTCDFYMSGFMNNPRFGAEF